jgi:hypothetical protein
MTEECSFVADLWRADAQDAWYFLTLPPDAAAAVRQLPRPPGGFGSVRVEATVGSTSWRTSVFPDTRSGSFLLPVRKAVRRAEDLEEGEPVTVTLRVPG